MKLGVIGGTALEYLVLENSRSQDVETPWGKPSSPLTCGTLGRTEVFFINRHGEDHSLPPHKVNYRANIAALSSVGVSGILAFNAVGGISEGMVPGKWVVPDQLIDYTYGREHTFYDGHQERFSHIDFTHPYTPSLRKSVLNIAQSVLPAIASNGTYGATQGPRLETAAEISRMARDGCDIVGMTGMPEAALAAEKCIAYASMALVVNQAAGIGASEITMEEIDKVMEASCSDLLRFLEAFCS